MVDRQSRDRFHPPIGLLWMKRSFPWALRHLLLKSCLGWVPLGAKFCGFPTETDRHLVSAFDCCEIDARTSQTDDATIDMKPLPPVGQKKPSPSRCATYRAGGDGRSWASGCGHLAAINENQGAIAILPIVSASWSRIDFIHRLASGHPKKGHYISRHRLIRWRGRQCNGLHEPNLPGSRLPRLS